MDTPKSGEIVTTVTPEGNRSVTIGAPTVRAFGVSPPTPSQSLSQLVRHLKGVAAAAEELQKILERQEKEKQ